MVPIVRVKLNELRLFADSESIRGSFRVPMREKERRVKEEERARETEGEREREIERKSE